MKPILLALLCVTLAGCCTRPHHPATPVSCVKSSPERELSAFRSLDKKADIADQVNALLIDRDITEIYVGGLEAIVAGCR